MKQLAIIIPAYKDTYLRDTLDSISKQTCKDFTLYIGDDCSPFNIEAIVDDFRDKLDIVYKRFDLNLGGKDLVAQWERCIAMSKYEPYLWLFSDDDVMGPNCVASYLDLKKEVRDNWLVHFNIGMIDGKGKLVKMLPPYPHEMTAKQYLDGKLLHRTNISYVVEFVFSRNLYIRSSGFQNFDLAWGADFITWLKFAGNCKGIKTVETIDAYIMWRSSDQNISPNKTHPIILRKIHSIIDNASYIKNWLKSYNYDYSFKYSKFPWGEMKRNRALLSKNDIDTLKKAYAQKIGMNIYSYMSYLYVKYFCK